MSALDGEGPRRASSPNYPPVGSQRPAILVPTALEVLEPSPGTLLRRRVFGHASLLIGGGVLVVIVAMALLRFL